MTSVLAAGVFVLAYVAGRRALVGRLAPAIRRCPLACNALALILGVALLTPPLVALAFAGLFKPFWLGAVCWLAAIPGLAGRAAFGSVRRRLDVADITALTAAVVFVVVAALGRSETLGAGRDQQIYVEAAVALSERASARATYSPLDEADRALLRDVSGLLVPDAVDAHPDADQSISLSHPLGWPVWLAIAHAMFGMDGVYAANSFVFALGGVLFFVLSRRVVQPPIAVAATIILFALPSSLWVARISLSEPLAMTLLLAIPLFASAGMRQSGWPIAVVLTAATLVRIDAALGVPATIAAALLARDPASGVEARAANRRFALTQLSSHLLALLAYCAFFSRFLRDLSGYIVVITFTSLGLTLAVYLLTAKTASSLRCIIESRIFKCVSISLLVCLFIFGAEIRPTLEPFSNTPTAAGVRGTRDFREDSVLNLATYISWPVLLAALGGVCYGIWNRWPIRGGLLRPILFALGLGPALLYLWLPHVSPDHPWAFRRFVTTIVPYSLLFAAVFVRALTSRLGRAGPALGALALVAPYSMVISTFGTQRLFFRENDGMTQQIAGIARELPQGLVVATGVDPNIAAALLVAYGKPVAFVNDDLARTDDFMRVSNWIDAKAKLGHPAWFLHSPEFWYTGASLKLEREWRINRQFIAPSERAPALSVATQASRIILTRVNGLDDSFATHMFGAERAWGSPGRHFFGTEVAPFGEFRFTDGFAWIDVPAKALKDAETLRFDVFSYAKAGKRRWLHVLIDERRAWDGSVEAGVNTLRISIPKPIAGDVARISLLSEVIDPSERDAGDPRSDLSIGLIGIRPLLPGEPLVGGPTMDGFRSSLSIKDDSVLPMHISADSVGSFVLDVSNIGTAYWPTVRELGGPAGAVQIALRWYRQDTTHGLVGDNRWPMAISLVAGDRIRIKVPLAPIGLDGKPLPPGAYDVRIGMVRETVALFADGNRTVTIPIVVTP